MNLKPIKMGMAGLFLLTSPMVFAAEADAGAGQAQMAQFEELMRKFGEALQDFDEGAQKAYMELFERLIETGSAVDAMVWKREVAEGLTPEDVETSMKSVANGLNLAKVAELPLYKDVEAKTGKPFRFVKIFMFCDSLTAAEMLAYSDAYVSQLPCRISLIEDTQGKLWLYTANMDLMIHGGKPLPPKVKELAVKVRKSILEIMDRAAAGDF